MSGPTSPQGAVRILEMAKLKELSDLFHFFIVKLGPEYKTKELGIGYQLMSKAVVKATGKSTQEVRRMFKTRCLNVH